MTSYALAEIAESLGVCVETVARWVASGEMRAVNVSRDRRSRKPRLRVLQADLDQFLSARATDHGAELQPLKRRRRVEVTERFV